MNSKDIGERTEAQVLAALLKKGKTVLMPFGDNQRYDMVIDEDNAFIRIQCKTGRKKNKDSFIIQTCSSYTHRGGGKKGYKGQADLFGVYYEKTNKVYLIPVNDVGERSCILRTGETKNMQQKGVRWAVDYEI